MDAEIAMFAQSSRDEEPLHPLGGERRVPRIDNDAAADHPARRKRRDVPRMH
jgi:hypothetical protein